MYWRCADRNCGSKGLREDWLMEMCAEVMGTDSFSEDDFTQRIDHIDVSPETELTFYLADGGTVSRSWPTKRKSHPWSEERHEHMSKILKEGWTNERRQATSEFFKKLRSEKKWRSR